MLIFMVSLDLLMKHVVGDNCVDVMCQLSFLLLARICMAILNCVFRGARPCLCSRVCDIVDQPHPFTPQQVSSRACLVQGRNEIYGNVTTM